MSYCIKFKIGSPLPILGKITTSYTNHGIVIPVGGSLRVTHSQNGRIPD
jgi:hypothetical protein